MMTDNEWQPMETAPKDGEEILVFLPPNLIKIANYYKDEFSKKPRPYWRWSHITKFNRARRPTHWMTLPEEPLFRKESE